MRKIRWSDAVEYVFAFWLLFWFGGAGIFAILDWLSVPLLPNILVVAGAIVTAIIVEQRFMKLRNSCPSCRQEWYFFQGAFICPHCGLRAQRPNSN